MRPPKGVRPDLSCPRRIEPCPVEPGRPRRAQPADARRCQAPVGHPRLKIGLDPDNPIVASRHRARRATHSASSRPCFSVSPCLRGLASSASRQTDDASPHPDQRRRPASGPPSRPPHPRSRSTFMTNRRASPGRPTAGSTVATIARKRSPSAAISWATGTRTARASRWYAAFSNARRWPGDRGTDGGITDGRAGGRGRAARGMGLRFGWRSGTRMASQRYGSVNGRGA
jgi:hypothetical protein